MEFDDLYMLIQTLNQNIPVGIIFDADAIQQEFLHITDPNIVREFMMKDVIPKESD